MLALERKHRAPYPSTVTGNRGETIMPVKVFYVQDNKLIDGLEWEINKWQKSLGSKASVTHTTTKP